MSIIDVENHTRLVEIKDSLSKIKIQTEQLLNNVHKNADELQAVTTHVEHNQQNHDVLITSLSNVDHSLQELSISLDWLVNQEK